jgi:trans-aconitate methyltransferase
VSQLYLSRPDQVRYAMATAARTEREWKGKVTPADPDCIGWMPSDPAQFLVLLIEAITMSGGDDFLEIGCGPGTKMLLARELFGLKAYGIENDPEMVKAAYSLGLGLTVEPADALGWGSYGGFGIVFFNRVFHGTETGAVKQGDLERQVWADMAPGAVVIAMNLRNKPPDSWIIVTDDWEARQGVWIKPPGA